nr:uncharacterized protein LOC109179731 [Ipomoea batatas]
MTSRRLLEWKKTSPWLLPSRRRLIAEEENHLIPHHRQILKKQNDVEPTAAIEVEHPVATETEVETLVADIATEVEPLVAEVANVEVQPPAAIPWLIPDDNVIDMIISNAFQDELVGQYS